MPKLVRDLIPQIIIKRRKIPITRIVGIEEFKKELITKLTGEAHKFQKDKNIEEMADIIEVFEAILKIYGFTHQELKTTRARKNLERGAFDKMIFLEKIKTTL